MATPKNPNKQKCHAHNRQGNKCGKDVVPGRNVCAAHGGKTPRGTASPHFKHGKFSTLLPLRWQNNFEAIIDHINLTSLRKDIALSQLMMDDLLMSFDEVGMGGIFKRLVELTQEYRTIRANPDRYHEGPAIIDAVLEQIEAGASEREKVDDWLYLQNHQRGLVESETRCNVLTDRVMTLEQLNVLTALILESIKKHVPDEEQRAALGTEIIDGLDRIKPSHNFRQSSPDKARQ